MSHRGAGGTLCGANEGWVLDFKALLKAACRRVLAGTPSIITCRVDDIEIPDAATHHAFYETFIILPNGQKYVSVDLYSSIEETENMLCAAIMKANDALTPEKKQWQINQQRHAELVRQQEARAKKQPKQKTRQRKESIVI